MVKQRQAVPCYPLKGYNSVHNHLKLQMSTNLWLSQWDLSNDVLHLILNCVLGTAPKYPPKAKLGNTAYDV